MGWIKWIVGVEEIPGAGFLPFLDHILRDLNR